MNVLVVDDNNINRLLIKKVLSKWGARSDFAENGLQAVEKLKNSKDFDAVLMDVYMPEMDGIEATKVIRALDDQYYKDLPIIALTASLLSTERHQIDAAGMNDYILKPFEPKNLFEKLSALQNV